MDEGDAVVEQVDRVGQPLGGPRFQVGHHVANVRRVVLGPSFLHPVGHHPDRHAATASCSSEAGMTTGAGTPARWRGRASPAAAPSTERPAAASSAARNPSTKSAPDANPPRAPKTATVIAIPSTPPSSRIVPFTPDAVATSRSATADTTALWPHGIAIETPSPPSTNGPSIAT